MKTALGRVGRHWSEVMTIAMGLVTGMVLIPEFPTTHRAPVSLDRLPDWQSWPVSVFMILGGIFWGHAVIHWFELLTTMWTWKRIGSGLSGIAWLVNSLAVLANNPNSISSWSIRFGIAGICWGVFIRTFHSETTTRMEIARRNDSRA